MKIIFSVLFLFVITGYVANTSGLLNNYSVKGTGMDASVKNDTSAVRKGEATKGFALVELFTSEGCSSCPPADALLAKLDEEKKENVYVLSYHVDYWDRLGWKDVFSRPEWTARQVAYVEKFGLQSAYTPQAVINGEQEFVGSSSSELYAAVDKRLNETAQDQLTIAASATGREISVSYKKSTAEKAIVNLLLVQTHALTAVRRGENSGKQLVHTNVVQELIKVTAGNEKGAVHFQVPANHTASDHRIIGFVQLPTTLKITAAAQTGLL